MVADGQQAILAILASSEELLQSFQFSRVCRREASRLHPSGKVGLVVLRVLGIACDESVADQTHKDACGDSEAD